MSISRINFLHEIGGKKNQEDYIWPLAGAASPDETVFIVCDGVGGSDNGEIASRFIAEFMARRVKEFISPQMSVELINELLGEARAELMAFAVKNGFNDEMATTFSIIIFYPESAFIAWCGDTRVYHVRDQKILFKTRDHSLVNTLVTEGEITEEEARLHPQKNIILRAIKADGSPIDAEGNRVMNIQPGDYFLLCTDGILENMSDEDIQSQLSEKNTIRKNLAQIFQDYCYGKTRDNYSMYLLQTGDGSGTVPSKSKKLPILIGSILFLLLLLFFYFMRNNTQSNLITRKVGPADSAAIRKDSLPYLEIENNEDGDSTQQDSVIHK